jgi:hypothetical protein
VLAVDIVMAPPAGGEPKGRVPVLVALAANQLGQAAPGGVVEAYCMGSLGTRQATSGDYRDLGLVAV